MCTKEIELADRVDKIKTNARCSVIESNKTMPRFAKKYKSREAHTGATWGCADRANAVDRSDALGTGSETRPIEHDGGGRAG